ncbi:hypothetical protein LIER_40941 [Lithospermum erythrorhizon]|uniref:Uncharacterized protein n=1 Tax=Lithospermum erythrorhizon TaxID=34254 RepID=A0AAV3R420_LITER
MGDDDAQLVLSIPLSKQSIRDKLVWNHTKSGIYLTCSGYRSARDMKKNGELRTKDMGTSSDGSSSSARWKGVWKLKVPPRVWGFIWKCMENALPLETNLRRRGIKVDNECVLCKNKSETLQHLFLDCSFRCRLWFATPWSFLVNNGHWRSFPEWWDYISKQLASHNLEEDMGKVEENGLRLANEYSGETKKVPRQSSNEAVTVLQGWATPSPGFVKINCDAGWSQTTKCGTTGLVCQDEAGQFVGAVFYNLGQVQSAAVAEVLAIREGMEWAWKQGWRRVEVESDAKVIIQSINGVYPVSLTLKWWYWISFIWPNIWRLSFSILVVDQTM